MDLVGEVASFDFVFLIIYGYKKKKNKNKNSATASRTAQDISHPSHQTAKREALLIKKKNPSTYYMPSSAGKVSV